MTDQAPEWESAVHFLALATRLEDEGQINAAKLLRAAVDMRLRRAAYLHETPSETSALAGEIRRAAETIASSSADLAAALGRAANCLVERRLPFIHETPDPYVCRTCGSLALEVPPSRCPTCGARPATFLHFPSTYWLEALDPFQALESLRHTPREVERLLGGLSEEKLNRHPEGGGWSLRNAIAHLRDAQGVLSLRAHLLLTEEVPILESKAVFEWATQEGEQPPSTIEIFASYAASRKETMVLLEHTPLKDWWRTGKHEEFGFVSLCQQASYFATHEVAHLPQMERLRELAQED